MTDMNTNMGTNGLFNWFTNPITSAPENVNAVLNQTNNGSNTYTNPITGVQSLAPTQPATFLRDQTGSFSLNNLGTALGGVQALGNLWNSYQQNKLAREQFNFQKNAYNTSLNDNRQTYNTALEDRIRARYNTEGRSSAEADQYINENRLG